MAMKFKVGDIVQLKSGGPKMTVVVQISDTMVTASWFAGAKNERANFHPDSLVVPAEADDKK